MQDLYHENIYPENYLSRMHLYGELHHLKQGCRGRQPPDYLPYASLDERVPLVRLVARCL